MPSIRCALLSNQLRRSVVLTLLFAALVGCGTRNTSTLSFSYRELGPDGYINQTLTITNHSFASFAPTLVVTPLDKTGHTLSDLHVTTAFGSDRGNLVIPPNGQSYDILTFHGPDAARVFQVKVHVKALTQVNSPAGPDHVNAQAADASGNLVSKFDNFDKVALINSNTTPVAVRIAYIVYDQPPPNVPQQAVSVTPIGGLITVPAQSTILVPVTAEAEAALQKYSNGPAVSLKAYFSH